MIDTYKLFQLGLVSQSDEYCKLYQEIIKNGLSLFKGNLFFEYWEKIALFALLKDL